MNITRFFIAAGLAAASLGIAGTADARPHGPDHDRGYHRGWNSPNHGRGHYRGWRGDHCRTEWRHHRRIRVCR